jgi:hypothetical protein
VRLNALVAARAGMQACGLIRAHGQQPDSVARAAQYGERLSLALEASEATSATPNSPLRSSKSAAPVSTGMTVGPARTFARPKGRLRISLP